MQLAGAVEQAELELGEFGQVVRAERPVAEDQVARDAAHVDRIEPTQVANDLLHGLGVHGDAPAAVLARVGIGFLAHDLQARVRIGQARAVAHGERFDVRRQLDRMADQHDHVRLAVAALHQVAQHALAAGVAEVGMHVEQQVDAALLGVAHRLEGVGGVRRDVRRVLAVEVEPAQAFGDRPAVQLAPDVHQCLAEQLDHAGLVARLDHDQRRVRADQGDEVVQFTHVGHPCRASPAGGGRIIRAGRGGAPACSLGSAFTPS